MNAPCETVSSVPTVYYTASKNRRNTREWAASAGPFFASDYGLVATGAFGLPVSINAALKPVASFSAGPVPQ
jgi:hypothetical protein